MHRSSRDTLWLWLTVATQACTSAACHERGDTRDHQGAVDEAVAKGGTGVAVPATTPRLDGSHVLVKPGTELFRDVARQRVALVTDPARPTSLRLASERGDTVELRTGGARRATCFDGPEGLTPFELTLFADRAQLERVTSATVSHRYDGELSVEIGPGARLLEDGVIEADALRVKPARPVTGAWSFTPREAPPLGRAIGIVSTRLVPHGILLGRPRQLLRGRGKRPVTMQSFERGVITPERVAVYQGCVGLVMLRRGPDDDSAAPLSAFKGIINSISAPPAGALRAGARVYWEDGAEAGQVLEPHVPELTAPRKQVGARTCWQLAAPAHGSWLCFDR